ncbi:MAG TPA: tetratricopeptide repeat protein, partial [Kofleriaceae bacterium]
RRFDEAITAAQRAAAWALGRHARIEARELLRQALAWLEQLPESDARDRTEIELRMQLGAVLITTEGYTSRELERSCQRTELLCARHADMPLPVKFGLWAVRLMRGKPDEVEPLRGWFERELGRGGTPIERMIASVSIGIYHYVRADYDRARRYFEDAMALFAPADHAGVVQTYGGCGGFYAHVYTVIVLWKLGRFGDAWHHARRSVALAESLDPYSLGGVLSFEMMLHVGAGDTARTRAVAERVHEIATRYEFPFLADFARCGRGWALARSGEAERAMADLGAGIDGIRQLGVQTWLPYCLGLLAETALALGDLDRAGRALDDALEICRTSIDRSHEPELLHLRGRLILARDPAAREPARAAFSEALALAQHHGGAALALRAATDLAALLRDDHRPGEAMAVLDPVYRGLAPDPDEPHLAPTRQLLAELSARTA